MLKERIKNIFYSLNRHKSNIYYITSIKPYKEALYIYPHYIDIMSKIGNKTVFYTSINNSL